MKLKVISSLLSIGLLTNFVIFQQDAVAATQQKVSYFMNGDCSDYYDEQGEYAFFEDEEDWSCYITVKFTPIKPQRVVRLQYWNSRKWLQESTSKTDSKGTARLYFDPYCDGNYCDGTWKYRVFVDSTTSGQKSTFSNNFEVSFYPGSYEEDTSEDDSGA